jgi:hypothetical protein
MTKEMHDNERIYDDMAAKQVSEADRLKVRNITLAWAKALDKLEPENTNVRLVFLTCLNLIEVMGPAYCRMAATHLTRSADQRHAQ